MSGLLACLVICLLWKTSASADRRLMWMIASLYLMEIPAAGIVYFNPHSPSNIWYYNLVLTGVYAAYISRYSVLFIEKKLAQTARVLALLFIVAHIMNMQFGQQMKKLCTNTLVPANIVLAILAFLHLREQVQRLTEHPLYQFSTWFSISTFVYFTGTVPIIAVLNYWSAENIELADKLYIINDVLNVFYFLLIIAGLIWTKIKQTYSTS